jgi:hypothetical protein
MGEQDGLNWVERRQRAEKHLTDSKSVIWHDLCASLTDASRSFNKLYGGKSEATARNGHRFRVVIDLGDRKRQVDLDFDEEACTIIAEYDASPVGSKRFGLKADHLSAFILDVDGNRLTPDKVSERILTASFFSGR